MIQPKSKPCRGTGKAIGNGCSEKTMQRKYGLCIPCWKSWLLTTDEGREVLEKQSINSQKNNRKQEKQEWNERKQTMRVTTHYKENKKQLGLQIQKLARMIDGRFGYNTCIDCGLPFTQAMDRDGGHFHSKGSNQTIRYNLHNIHSQKSNCNQNGLGGGKNREYLNGLVLRYSAEYAIMVDVGLQQKYTYIGLKESDYPDKLKTVRSIIRNFDTFQFDNSIKAREQLNTIIGIYL